MTFARLNRGDVIALVAALALLLVMSVQWYTTQQAQQERQFQQQVVPQINREETPSPSDQAGQAAAAQEKTAWRASGVVDRLLLVALVAAAALAIAAAFMRAAGRRLARAPSLSALASAAALAATALIAYRILVPPGHGAGGVVELGAPLGLVCAGALAFGARIATLIERTGADSASGAAVGTPSVDPAA